MGGATSKNRVQTANNAITDEKMEELKMMTSLTAAELQRVLVIFNKLDIFQTEQVDFSEILAHVDFIKNSPFGERMLEVYDLDCSRKLMLKEFAMLCSIFVPSCP
eukprot:CAMPEP_0113912776 /NCGR_PEP_ID=MMETSP0780_2-20120614/29135_1 /TAXON_ID=652834 /ORGANISM="Palpitomonas bilix" /LENGTH=104 /DNA_ID=CAMNT_0000909813 /DNA_START=585 /DNA_END=895 /DNA_ORIENTATION=+ /assembly_acc=CAM_ASM_000599